MTQAEKLSWNNPATHSKLWHEQQRLNKEILALLETLVNGVNRVEQRVTALENATTS